MFNFFKKWKKKETITVHFSEIGEWFEEQVKPLFQKIHSTKVENQKLVVIRDLLLPKLMSGEIKV